MYRKRGEYLINLQGLWYFKILFRSKLVELVKYNRETFATAKGIRNGTVLNIIIISSTYIGIQYFMLFQPNHFFIRLLKHITNAKIVNYYYIFLLY